MKLKKSRLITFILLLLIIVLSGIMSFNTLYGSEFCLVNDGDKESCSNVQSSEFGEILGIKVAYLGLLASIVLSTLFYFSNTPNRYKKDLKEIFLLATFLGALLAVYFISVQIFILKQICSTCMVIDTSIILIFLMTYISRRR
jgi:uncharacterized membrane protein